MSKITEPQVLRNIAMWRINSVNFRLAVIRSVRLQTIDWDKKL